MLGGPARDDEAAERVADEHERLAQPQGAQRAIERGHVLVHRVLRVLRRRRAPEAEDVDRDGAVPRLQQRHEVLERHRGRRDAVHEHDRGPLPHIGGDVQQRRAAQSEAATQPLEEAVAHRDGHHGGVSRSSSASSASTSRGPGRVSQTSIAPMMPSAR